MADVNEILEGARQRADIFTNWASGEPNFARDPLFEDIVNDLDEFRSAVENVLALCDKALAVKVTGASEGDVAMAAMAAQVRKAITDALNGEQA